MRSPRSGRVPTAFLLLLSLWCLALGIAFWLKQSQLLLGYDGSYMQDLAVRQFLGPAHVLTIPYDFLQGMGDVYFSALNFTLLPEYILYFLLGGGTVGKVAAYLWVAAELTLATYFLSVSLGSSRGAGWFAALALVVGVFPIAGRGLLHPVAAVAPHAFSFVATTMVAVGCFWRYGRTGWLRDLPYLLVAFCFVIYMFHAGATVLILALPFLVICGLAGVLAAETRPERIAKLGAVTITTVFLIAFGPAAYMAGLLLNSAAAVIPSEFANNRTDFRFASILFHWTRVGPTGTILVVMAFLGAVLAAFDKTLPRLLRVLAIVMTTYFVARVTFWVLTVLFDFWRGPSALYFEFFVLPIYAIFATLLVERLALLLPNTVRVAPLPALVGAFALGVVSLASLTPNRPGGFGYPPKPNAFIEAMVSPIPDGGSPFPGRTADFIGGSIKADVGWPQIVNLDRRIYQKYGNELRSIGLSHFGIPGLFQNGSTQTPAFFLFVSRAFARPTDDQLRPVQVLRNPKPRLLEMIGVRYIESEQVLPDAGHLIETLDMGEGLTLYLYELPDPNLGDYSPTAVFEEATVEGAISRVIAAEFDPRSQVVVLGSTDHTTLESATDVTVSVEGSSFVLRAQSPSTSVLVLPIEYSHCLRLSGGGDASTFRANVVATGIRFSGRLEATLTPQYGPFVNSWCRLLDLAELVEAGIQRVAPASDKGD